MVVVFVGAGLLFGVAATQAREHPSTIGLDLRQLVREKQADVQNFEAQNYKLQSRVDEQLNKLQATSSTHDTNEVDTLLNSWVSGPGILVELSDAPATTAIDPDQNVSNNDLVVHQQDLDAVMNALWRGGAEAMSVQGIRITPQVQLRCIGNVILIGSQTFAPPYQIEAIGDEQTMLASIEADPQLVIYKQYVDAYGLGFKTEIHNSLRLPPITEKLSVKHAQPLDENDK